MNASVTAIYAALCGFLLIGLAAKVVMVRRKEKIGLGHGDSKLLNQVVRAHGNATEYVPIGLFLLLVLELNGTSPLLLHILGASLVVGRLLHAMGLYKSSATSFGRFAGTVMTWLMILAASAATLITLF